ncbi:M4 family metallopeptidase [Streptomyces sp. Z26]|uniref:M4 family metallopeptidase n=1 Tax=Streptomyces TaxID=1883 RepID=UPI000EF14EFF|nr:M4 family metallopeptidase [Streptomyces sp. Z26]RLL68975.1 M4 family peptidase [Streptomyces sp. Z26]
MRISKKTRISALAATAALVAAGVTAGTAGASAPKQADVPGGAPAALSASQYTKMVKAADTADAKAATAKEIGLGSKEGLEVKDVIKNQDGSVHTRYARTFDGLPVLGGDLVVHETKSGYAKRVTKATKAEIKVSTTTAAAAQKPATPKAKGSEAPRKVVWAATGKPVLAWETVTGGLQKDGTPNELHTVTDAQTGKKLYEYQGIHNGTGESMYAGSVELGTSDADGKFTLTDADRGGNQTLDLANGQGGEGSPFTDDDDKWGDGTAADKQTAAVDAHYGAQLTWDYYKNVHKRDGIAGDGKGAVSNVHYGDNYVNAFWDDSCFCMTYGDGENNEHPLTSIDVAAHEMSHGVTSHTAGLEYAGESGGLNEATSDIFAAAVEFSADNPEDVPDYMVGEEIDINGDGTPLRYMDEPSKDGSSLDFWDENAGDVDVHYSSGIANHFFFLLSVGSGEREVNGVKYNSPTADDSTVEGIGIEKAEQIWYKALSEEMTSTTDYAAARAATVTAATGLYGEGSEEVKTVEAAWAAVNVK